MIIKQYQTSTNQGKKAMKTDLLEDSKDSQEIKKQKQEQKSSTETMSNWEFGKGLTKTKEENKNVRN